MRRRNDAAPMEALRLDAAIQIFTTLSGLGYGVSIKHLRGLYFIEVPVRLRGDASYGKEAEIADLASRVGLTTIQTGQTLRIIGR